MPLRNSSGTASLPSDRDGLEIRTPSRERTRTSVLAPEGVGISLAANAAVMVTAPMRQAYCVAPELIRAYWPRGWLTKLIIPAQGRNDGAGRHAPAQRPAPMASRPPRRRPGNPKPSAKAAQNATRKSRSPSERSAGHQGRITRTWPAGRAPIGAGCFPRGGFPNGLGKFAQSRPPLPKRHHPVRAIAIRAVP
jgi:hypothetical protein